MIQIFPPDPFVLCVVFLVSGEPVKLEMYPQPSAPECDMRAMAIASTLGPYQLDVTCVKREECLINAE